MQKEDQIIKAIEGLGSKFSSLDTKFTSLDTKVSSIDKTVNKHTEILNSHSVILADHSTILADHSALMEKLTVALVSLTTSFNDFREETGENFTSLNKQMYNVQSDVTDIKGELSEANRKINILEHEALYTRKVLKQVDNMITVNTEEMRYNYKDVNKKIDKHETRISKLEEKIA